MSTSKVSILIEAVDKASQQLQNVGKSVKGLAGKLTKLGDVAKVAGGMLLRDLVHGATASFEESVKLGGQVDTLKASFDRLVAASGSTTLSLDTLRKATGGTVSDVDLLQSANQALLLGLPTEQLGDLYDAAIKLGHGMGIDAMAAVQSLTTGLGRQSKLVLDNLGVVFQASDAYDWYAQQLGKSSSELTENEKKLGWQKYAIMEITEKASTLGDVTSETQKSQERWGATIKNLQTSIGRMLGPLSAVTPALNTMMPLIGTLAGTMLPQLINMQNLSASSSKVMAAAQWLLNAAMSANPITLVVIAIAALAAGLIIAYKTCKPFRDAVNGIGKALSDFLKPAIDAVSDTFSWLWSNILSPFIKVLQRLWNIITDNPLLALISPITAIVYVIKHWQEILEALHKAWNIVVGAFETGIKAISDFLKPLTDTLGAIGNVIGGIASALFGSPRTIFEDAALGMKKLNAEMKKTNAIGNFAPAKTVAANPETGVVTQQITVYPTINIGNVSGNMDLERITDAVNRGIADALRRRM